MRCVLVNQGRWDSGQAQLDYKYGDSSLVHICLQKDSDQCHVLISMEGVGVGPACNIAALLYPSKTITNDWYGAFYAVCGVPTISILLARYK